MSKFHIKSNVSLPRNHELPINPRGGMECYESLPGPSQHTDGFSTVKVLSKVLNIAAEFKSAVRTGEIAQSFR